MEKKHIKQTRNLLRVTELFMQSSELAGMQQALLMNGFEIGKPSTGRRESAMEASKDRGGRQSG